MKKSIIVFFCLSYSICFSQGKIYKLRDSQLRALHRGIEYVQKYSDSLNAYPSNKCKELPSFFYEYDFDINQGYRLSTGMHNSVSIRKLIIDKIVNVKLLYAVLRSRDKRLRKSTKIPRKQYMGDVIIPLQEYSTYKLVKYRIQELENEENMGKKASNYPYK